MLKKITIIIIIIFIGILFTMLLIVKHNISNKNLLEKNYENEHYIAIARTGYSHDSMFTGLSSCQSYHFYIVGKNKYVCEVQNELHGCFHTNFELVDKVIINSKKDIDLLFNKYEFPIVYSYKDNKIENLEDFINILFK